MAELSIARDKVAEVIVLAREMNRAEKEFDAFVSGLNDEEQASLVAIFWIGRGNFDAEDYAEALETAYNEKTTPTHDYLKGSPHLADHLEAGMEALGIDVTQDEEDLY
ncbi:MAG: DUF3775 domain-containing protein [Rhodobacteraceae bacterium]|nr:DUF3775 domain-containing protein [Paracoccaceae bacterium]